MRIWDMRVWYMRFWDMCFWDGVAKKTSPAEECWKIKMKLLAKFTSLKSNDVTDERKLVGLFSSV